MDYQNINGEPQEFTGQFNENILTDSVIDTFVGENALFYRKKWTATSSPYGWNWCAFIVTLPWLAYRKMYVEAAIVFLARYVLAFLGASLVYIAGMVPSSVALNFVINFMVMMTGGLLGNTLYRSKALRVHKKSLEVDESLRSGYLSSRGGTSYHAALIIILLNALSTLVFR